MYKTRLVSNEIFSPLNKIHRGVGRAKDLSGPQVHSKDRDKFPETEGSKILRHVCWRPPTQRTQKMAKVTNTDKIRKKSETQFSVTDLIISSLLIWKSFIRMISQTCGRTLSSNCVMSNT
jgi:hypothetical protein